MFENIIGNTNIKTVLEKSIKQNKLSHSYLFVGIQGIGKKMIATEFAKMILCLDDNKYCNHCKSCIEFDTNNNPDFVLISPDENNIKIEQIRDIFTGKITNWNQIGGNDSPIVVVSREAGSGTRTAFEEGVEYSEEELVKDAIISKGNGDVKTTVSTNENAIGFVSFEYVDDAISSINVNGIEPTAANVKAGSYALSRPFLAVTNEQYITEDSQKLIDYITSEEGQQIVEDNKLITID